MTICFTCCFHFAGIFFLWLVSAWNLILTVPRPTGGESLLDANLTTSPASFSNCCIELLA